MAYMHIPIELMVGLKNPTDTSGYMCIHQTLSIESTIGIEDFGTLGIGIGIDKETFKLLVLVLVLIRKFSNSWYWY